MILVVGTGRSGTSCLARLLQEELEVDMGGPARVNSRTPKGNYERRDGWPRLYHRLFTGQITRAQFLKWGADLMEDYEEPWGYKNPEICICPELSLKLFQPDYVILGYRNLNATAQSFSKWYGFPMEMAHQRVRFRYWSLMRALEDREYLEIDMTERRDEDELVEVMGDYIS